MNTLKEVYRAIGEMWARSRLLLIFILLLGVNQLVYSYVAGALVLNLLLLAASLSLYNLSGKERFNLYGLLTSLLVLGLYLVGIFTDYEFLQESVVFTASFIIVVNFIIFTFKREDFLNNFYLALFQMATALLYFIILYGVIYLISFLVDQVFFLKLPYDGIVFRLANSLASMLGLFVLFSKREEELSMSRFFEPLFKKILPKLSLVFGSLSLVYHFQILLGFTRDYYSGTFYSLMGLFFLFYLLSYWQEEASKEKGLLLGLFILLALSHLMIKFNLLGRVEDYERGRGIYHELLAVLSFVVYALVFLRDTGKMALVRWLAIFLAMLLLMPPLGYALYDRYDFSDMTKKTSSLWDDFHRRREDPVAEEEGFYFYYNAKGQDVTSIEGYRYLAQVNLFYDIKFFSYEDLEVLATSDGKFLEIKRAGKEESLDIYSAAKALGDDKYEIDSPLVFELEELGLRIYVDSYSYYKDHFDLAFRILID